MFENLEIRTYLLVFEKIIFALFFFKINTNVDKKKNYLPFEISTRKIFKKGLKNFKINSKYFD